MAQVTAMTPVAKAVGSLDTIGHLLGDANRDLQDSTNSDRNASLQEPFRTCLRLVGQGIDEKWRDAYADVESVEGIEFDAILRRWVEERTVEEVVKR